MLHEIDPQVLQERVQEVGRCILITWFTPEAGTQGASIVIKSFADSYDFGMLSPCDFAAESISFEKNRWIYELIRVAREHFIFPEFSNQQAYGLEWQDYVGTYTDRHTNTTQGFARVLVGTPIRDSNELTSDLLIQLADNMIRRSFPKSRNRVLFTPEDIWFATYPSANMRRGPVGDSHWFVSFFSNVFSNLPLPQRLRQNEDFETRIVQSANVLQSRSEIQWKLFDSHPPRYSNQITNPYNYYNWLCKLWVGVNNEGHIFWKVTFEKQCAGQVALLPELIKKIKYFASRFFNLF